MLQRWLATSCLVLVTAAGLAACGDDRQDAIAPADLAVEVEHVADLLADDRDCEALQAVRVVETLMAAATLDTATTDVVGEHVQHLRDAVTCEPGQQGSPSPDTRDPSDEVDDDPEPRDRRGPPPGRGRGN